MAQLAEQLICNQQVIGSSPIIGFQFNNTAGWSSLEARRAHNPKVTGSNPVPAIYAQIAQLVEQRTENPRVAGSIPALGIFLHGKCLSVENKYLYKKDIVGKVSAQRILRLIIRKVRIGKHVFIGRNSGNRSGNSEVY